MSRKRPRDHMAGVEEWKRDTCSRPNNRVCTKRLGLVFQSDVKTNMATLIQTNQPAARQHSIFDFSNICPNMIHSPGIINPNYGSSAPERATRMSDE